MKVRKTTLNDLEEIQKIYAIARKTMKDSGNPNQWGEDKPELSLLLGDIEKGQSFVLEDEEGIYGVFAFILGEDPTYGYIEGKWLNDEPYGTIHRIASSTRVKGVLSQAVSFGSQFTDNIRIDTHHDNKIMQHLLTKNGFKKCGIIYLLNGDPRIAYQLELKK